MTFKKPLLAIVGAALFGLGVPLPQRAAAGLLAPSRPSQIVTVRYNGASCTADPGAYILDSLVDPADGSLSPFAVPNGHVLVITDATFNFNKVPGGDFTVHLNAFTATAPFAFVPIAS